MQESRFVNMSKRQTVVKSEAIIYIPSVYKISKVIPGAFFSFLLEYLIPWPEFLIS